MVNTDNSEYLTRKTRIDILLKEQGWLVSNKNQILEEVDTKQSNFSEKDYRFKDQTLGTPGEHRYLDYLLLDKNGEPIAVIEAKKSSKDPIVGKKQAEEYLKDIKRTYKKDVFIYLANGNEIWFWNYDHAGVRQVAAFHTLADLDKYRFQNAQKSQFHTVSINKEIINRPYQIEAIKRIQEGMDLGKRKFLIVMATGTGKTRVSMSIIDTLLKTNRVKNVLFLADRRALRDQAFNKGYKIFFPHESKAKIISGEIDKTARLFVSTIQTLDEIYEQKDENGQNVVSPGFFDLIISDEAHRSIYNKWKTVFTYFDCYQIGLTATPAEDIERDTFRFFDCDEKVPTFNYGFNEAVNEKHLVNFKRHEARTTLQLKGIRREDLSKGEQDRLSLEEGLETQELNWDGTKLEKKVATKETSEAIAKEFMEYCLKDDAGLPCKTIIFAVTHQHARRLWEAFERLFPQYKGKLVQIIDYQTERADVILDEFSKEKWPRIAISVDMLDTGVDIPEVANLVFAKPVFSKIKFWQMIGRGSRNNEACKHLEWLPDGKKEYFLIFDFWNNFEYFKMHPEGKSAESSDSIATRIFRVRLDIYKLLLGSSKKTELEAVKKKMLEDIRSLPIESVSVRPHKDTIDKALDEEFWTKISVDPYDYLRKKILPLIRFKTGINLEKASFELKLEKLRLALLEKDAEKVEGLGISIAETLDRLPRTLKKVKSKESQLRRALSEAFWKAPSNQDVDLLEESFLDLMEYLRSEPQKTIIVDLADTVQERKWIEYGPAGEGDYVDKYRAKVEKKVKDMVGKHPTLTKIKNDESITEKDILDLEKSLNSPELYINEESLRKVYEKNNGSLVQFVKMIIGLYQFPDPKTRIEEAFKAYMIERNYLSGDQVNFLRTLQTVFLDKKQITLKDFYEAPFTNLGNNIPTPLFNKSELQDMIIFCNRLKSEVFPS